MQQIDVEEAKLSLDKLLAEVLKGEDVVLTREMRPVARIVAIQQQRRRPQFGSAAGRIWISPDFDEPLQEFDEYR